MKIYDIILIAILLLLSFLPITFIRHNHAKKARISVDNKIYRVVDLDKNDSFRIETNYGENIVEVKDGAIFVKKANCHDKICVKTGNIKKTGEVIACLPHKILIEIVDEDD